MKKKTTKKKKKSNDTHIDIFILNKYIDNTIDTIIKTNKKHTMNQLTPNQEYALAKKLSEALNEPENFPLYLKFAKTVSKEFLLEKLSYVLSKDDILNKAAYFNSVVNTYGYRK